jgi:hypothetical protein
MFPEPGGIAGLWLFAESHLAVHTYPETQLGRRVRTRDREVDDIGRDSHFQLMRGQRLASYAVTEQPKRRVFP